MTPGKRVIANADDLGRTAGVNRGIIEAHRRGIVTSASLMVGFPAVAEAASLARENAELGVGLHLTLTDGVPSLSPQQVPDLVDDRGRFHLRPEALEGVPPAQIQEEARAQLKRFRKLLGRDPTHFDSHHHAHRSPAVLEAVLTLAWETGLPVRQGSADLKQRLEHEGIPTTEGFVEEFHGEAATLEALLAILFAVPVGTTEVMCHPGLVDDELRASSSYADERRKELDVLVHREVRQAIQAVGIKLIHYGEL